MKIQLISLALVVTLAAPAVGKVCPLGDLNGDCKVDFYDLAVFAEQWLNTGGCSHPACADLDGVNRINMADYALMVGNWFETGIPLVINEFVASNNSDSGISDPEGDYDDWIEIYNSGDTAIDLGGMYLTDDLDEPTKWQIPEGYPAQTTIGADDYILIWADEDTSDGSLHADFKLSADGEQIGLFDTDGITLIDGITFGEQVTNVSYGRYPDANDYLRFFVVPTPLANNSAVYNGIVEAPEFSHERGFYETGFNNTIATTTNGAEIYYTTDGNEPIVNEQPSLTSTKYSNAISISSTTCLRAAAIKTGWMPSPIATHTYIFGAGSAIKSMPVVSLVGDEYATFFEPNGIMAIVGGYYDGEGEWTQGSDPDAYNNPIQRGIEYERPVSFEIIDSQAGANLQIDCGIRVHGSDYTRPRYHRDSDDWLCNSNKFSFNLFFRSSYGNNRLEYQFFPFIDIDRYKSIVLRAGHNDICSPFVKDEWTRRLFLEMGAAQLTGVFANLYLNGDYKYYYNPCGRLDEEFFQEWFNTDNSFDVIDQSGIREGDMTAWNALINYATSHNLSNTAYYEYVASKLDITEFIDFLILEIHIGNFDWPGNNWATYREKTDSAKFRFVIWDAEGMAETWIFGNNCEYCYKTAFEDFPSWTSPTGLNHLSWDALCKLYRALKANAEFRQLFADRIHKHYRNNGIMTLAHLLEKWWEVQNEVAAVLPYQQTYVPSVFLPAREPYTMAAFEDNDLIDLGFGYPIFKVNGSYKHGGYVTTSDTFTIDQSTTSGTLYYTLDGSDPRLPADAAPQETTLAAENATKKVRVPTSDIGTGWRGGNEPYNDSSWTGGTGGVGYERGSGYESYIDIDVESEMSEGYTGCYIRIPFTIDSGDLDELASLTLKVMYDDGFVAYINGTEVKRDNFTGTPQWNSAADNYLETSSFTSYDISSYISELDAGDNILAIHGMNNSTTSSDFLICVELIGANSVPGNISPSAIEYSGGFHLDKSTHLKSRVLKSGTGQWSALNEAIYGLPGVADNLRITEVMYHPQDTNDPNDPNEEYIELKNTGASTINLNLVGFTNGIDWTFGDVELAAGGYILVVKDISAFEAEYGAGRPVAGKYSGSLDNGGERIRLEDAMGTTILDFSYSDGWRSITDGDGYSLTIVDAAGADVNSWDVKAAWRASAHINGSPGWDDSGIIPNPGDIVINEVMSHSHAGAPDWIELYNTSNSSINIGGWYLSDSGDNLMKYEIASDTVIGSGEYLVFYQDVNFGNLNDPGCHIPFALSENGEVVCLTSAVDANGVLTGYRQKEDFRASETGVSFGQYYKASTDNYNFVSMDYNTPGSANAYPKVGPIVIAGIMYHPDWPAGGSYTDDEYEYIELHNISSEAVTLYDYIEGEPWKFTDGIEWTFPASPNEVTIPASGKIVIVKDIDAFTFRYPGVSTGIIYGPYDGWLANDGEKVELCKPADLYLGTRYYIRVDRVDYSDGSHPQDCPGDVDLWPTDADGGGDSLTRIDGELYGNDPNNWQAAAPTPGG